MKSMLNIDYLRNGVYEDKIKLYENKLSESQNEISEK